MTEKVDSKVKDLGKLVNDSVEAFASQLEIMFTLVEKGHFAAVADVIPHMRQSLDHFQQTLKIICAEPKSEPAPPANQAPA